MHYLHVYHLFTSPNCYSIEHEKRKTDQYK